MPYQVGELLAQAAGGNALEAVDELDDGDLGREVHQEVDVVVRAVVPKNRDKARLKVARAHAQVSDARREFHHQFSTQLIRENQAIGVEDLAVKGLARTRLAKSVHDAGWAQFVAMLEYKTVRYGRTLVKIGRFEPTFQTCSACGVKDGPKPLHIREWTCPACGTVHERDHNAAKNVKTAAGLAVAACGAQVGPGLVPAQREEAGSHGFPPEPRAA